MVRLFAIRWHDNPGRSQDERKFPPAEDVEAGVSAERPTGLDQEPCQCVEVSETKEDNDEEEHNKEMGQGGAGDDEVNDENDDDDEFDSESYWVETTDELYCGYDSTWETKETPQKRARRTRAPRPVSEPEACLLLLSLFHSHVLLLKIRHQLVGML